jgi:hypothetical protein
MRRLYNLLFVLGIAAVALAQTTVTIPAVTFANGVLSVNSAPIKSLTLDSLEVGKITLSGTGPYSTGSPKTFTTTAQSLGPTQRYSFTIATLANPNINACVANPTAPIPDAFVWVSYISAANTITVQVTNVSGTWKTLPASTWLAKVY